MWTNNCQLLSGCSVNMSPSNLRERKKRNYKQWGSIEVKKKGHNFHILCENEDLTMLFEKEKFKVWVVRNCQNLPRLFLKNMFVHTKQSMRHNFEIQCKKIDL